MKLDVRLIVEVGGEFRGVEDRHGELVVVVTDPLVPVVLVLMICGTSKVKST